MAGDMSDLTQADEARGEKMRTLEVPTKVYMTMAALATLADNDIPGRERGVVPGGALGG